MICKWEQIINLHIPLTFLLLGRVPCSEHTETGQEPKIITVYMFECENKASHVITQVNTIFLQHVS